VLLSGTVAPAFAVHEHNATTITDNLIVNADINTSASIALSKLSLGDTADFTGSLSFTTVEITDLITNSTQFEDSVVILSLNDTDAGQGQVNLQMASNAFSIIVNPQAIAETVISITDIASDDFNTITIGATDFEDDILIKGQTIIIGDTTDDSSVNIHGFTVLNTTTIKGGNLNVTTNSIVIGEIAIPSMFMLSSVSFKTFPALDISPAAEI